MSSTILLDTLASVGRGFNSHSRLTYNMPEWLMGLPAKQLDYVLVGSNPTVVDSR